MPTERYPNLFIVGAQKSGTSSLACLLADHPQVFMSYPKEPGFLAFGGQGYAYLDGYGKPSPADQWVVNTEADYRALFSEASEQHKIVGEASTWYLAVPGMAARIKAFSPDAKIIVILRNPVDRAYSAWTHAQRDGLEPLGFRDALAAESEREEVDHLLRYHFMGSYSAQLAAYQEIFPAAQLLVLFFDDLRDKPDQVHGWIYDFLDIAIDFQSADSQRRYNRSGIPRSRLLQSLLKSHSFKTFWKNLLPGKLAGWIKGRIDNANLQAFPPMEDSIRTELQEYYRQDIDKLMTLTGRDLSVWLQ